MVGARVGFGTKSRKICEYVGDETAGAGGDL